MQFNVTELDSGLLKERSFEEASIIHSKASTARGRSLEEIAATTMYGHAAECYLLELGFDDDPRPYKDVIDPAGNPVEVKVTEGDYYVPYVLKRCNEAASQKWREYPEILYIFIGDKKTGDYHLEGIYNWNGTQFIKE